ncbi:MAG: hypothetical protein QM501_10765, partial [Gimesia sp.]
MSKQSNQYKQILRTYWQRPLIVLLAVLSIPIFIFFVVGRTDGNVIQIGPRPHAPGRIESVYTVSKNIKHEDRKTLQTLSELLERVDPEEVTSLNIIRLHVDDPLPDLSPFQNLVYLDLGGFELTDANIDQICHLPKLDALVVNVTRLPTGAIQRFGQKVSELELLAFTLEAHLNEIPQMSKVKLLALHLTGASPDLIEHIVQVPQLQQLTLAVSQNIEAIQRQSNKSQGWNYIDLNKKQIAQLRNHPTLKEVYADWFFMKRSRKFSESVFLPVRALPIIYSKSKIRAISGTMFAMALLFAILFIQLWGHFISPAAKVVPHYLIPHRRVAVGIFSAGVLLYWLALLRYDFGMLSSLSLVLFLPAICCFFLIAQLSKKVYLQWMAIPLIFSFLIFIPIFNESGFKAVASTAIWFLWGYMPILSLSIIAIETIFILWCLTNLRLITEFTNENYSSIPAFSPWDPERIKQIQWKRLQEKKQMNIFLWFIDRGTTNLKYCGGSTLQMVHLWRQGNTFRPLMIVMLLLLMVFFGFLFNGIRCLITGAELFPENLRSLSNLLGMPCGIAIILPTAIWWQRRKSLDVESIKPVSRNNFVKQLYLSLALDHWLVLTCLIGLTATNFPLFNASSEKTQALSMLLLFGIAGPLWILGINSAVLAFKRSWVVALSMILLIVIPFVVFASGAFLCQSYSVGEPEELQLLLQM